MTFNPLIDITYFKGELTIAQLEQEHVREVVDGYIKKYEFELLQNLMGLNLFEAFYLGMQGDAIDNRWLAMAYGKTFTLDESKVKYHTVCSPMGRNYTFPNLGYGEKVINYTGLIEKKEGNTSIGFAYDGYNANSPIANYVYYFYMKNQATTTVGSAEVVMGTQNAGTVNAGTKMIKAWNDLCDWVVNFYLFLDQHIEDYPEYNLPIQSRYYLMKQNQFNL